MKIYSRVVELASTPDARARGLMNRRALYGADGMLFTFDAPTDGAFWNQNTLLPLDILFIDGTGRVVDRLAMQTITETSGQVTSYAPRTAYSAALEILRGRAPVNIRRIALSPLPSQSGQRVIFLYD